MFTFLSVTVTIVPFSPEPRTRPSGQNRSRKSVCSLTHICRVTAHNCDRCQSGNLLNNWTITETPAALGMERRMKRWRKAHIIFWVCWCQIKPPEIRTDCSPFPKLLISTNILQKLSETNRKCLPIDSCRTKIINSGFFSPSDYFLGNLWKNIDKG